MKKNKIIAALSIAGLLSVSAPAINSMAAWRTTSAGTMYTQTAAPGYVTGVKKIGNYYYYFNDKGIMQKGFQVIKGKDYYLNEKGIMLKGWITVGSKRYYADANYVLAKSKWVDNYYFLDDCSMAVNQWVNGRWVGPDGRFTGVINNCGWITENGKTYYYNTDHQKVTGWIIVDGKTYYLNAQGVLQKGWFRVGASTYYGAEKDGAISKNKWVNNKYLTSNGAMAVGFTKIGNVTYYFNSNGIKQTGWVKLKEGAYYFNDKGAMLSGQWLKRRYLLSDGKMAVGWLKIGKYSYYFRSDGNAVTGAYTIEGKRYAFNNKGRLYKNKWITAKGARYYASNTGALLSGLNAIGGKLYYFDPTTCKMAVKALRSIGNDSYYFSNTGAAVKNVWMTSNKKRYYFKPDGKMAKSIWVTDKSGNRYYADANGIIDPKTKVSSQSGWVTTNGVKYYFGSGGKAVTGLQTIGGKKYYFDSSGKMVTGIVAANGRKYYFYPEGHMATSVSLIIGGKEYTINQNGIITSEVNLTVSGNSTGAKIANFALKYVGNRYVYGGTSLTNGADCSGFCQTVMATFGLKIVRVADDQMKAPSSLPDAYRKQGYLRGSYVSMDSLQPGDMIFYGSGNYASHVGIYIGNKKIVHASNSQPYPAGGIKVSAYDYQTPIKAVRYWK